MYVYLFCIVSAVFVRTCLFLEHWISWKPERRCFPLSVTGFGQGASSLKRVHKSPVRDVAMATGSSLSPYEAGPHALPF